MNDHFDEAIIDQSLLFLKNILTPPRLQHSISVMQVMGELAEIYDLDPVQARLAGLLHDAAKDLSIERQLALAEEAQVSFQYDCERHPVYLHAPVGAYAVSKELGIADDEVLNAIAAHSDGGERVDSGLCFQWCLQAADILAPISEWQGIRKFKNVVYAGRLKEAALLRCGWLLEYFERASVPIHPNLEKKFQTLSDQLQVTESFFEKR